MDTSQAPVSQNNKNYLLINLLRTLRKHWICAAVTWVVCIIASILYINLTPPKYTATSQLFATYSDSSNTSENYSNINNANSYIASQLKSYPALVKTDTVLEPVVTELHLSESTRSLASKVTASNPTGTSFINISTTTGIAEQSAKISNAVSESLIHIVADSLYSQNQPSPVKISIVQRAQVPGAPSSPKSKLILLAGFAGGFVLALIAAILRNMFSTRIQDEDELREYIDAPILGRIPESDFLEKGHNPIIIDEPGGPLAEDFRRVATKLSFVSPVPGTNSRLIVITAVGANEGKTTTSVNLATALAENGASVLLIDADLRHPSVSKKLDIDGSAGLTHVLSGQASVKDVVQPYWKSSLHVMPAGPKPPNAASLLTSALMTDLLAHALRQYDYVIVDTAPLMVANEAALIAKQGGALVLISRRGATLKSQLTNIASELTDLNIMTTGFIINCAKDDKKSLSDSHYYYYTSSSNINGKHNRNN